ncbi:MAG: terpene cyclase/mutase family protein, partial [Thermoguttaceae bacterium]|nr:terpene cyclase/mutase family protein [Thermoguttaceae bacterium]
ELPGGAPRGSDSPAPGGNAATTAGKADIASLGSGPLETPAGTGVTGPNQRLGGLQVQIAAPPGAGGLGLDPAPVVGLPSRRARPEGEVVHDAPERFVFARSGGTLAMDGRIPEEPKPAFRGRDPSRRGARARAFGGTEATEQAVERGIEFLARHQFPQGHWALDRSPHDGSPGYTEAAWGEMNSDTAATGLALLAFLGAGYTHMDGKHQATVRRGIEWLLRNQQPDGRLFTPGSDRTRFAQFYAHAMATIALCEAYGMTGDRLLREPTQRAIGFILETQHPTLGGWRYAPQLESDTPRPRCRGGCSWR